ncbi:MAG TPA: alkaline phosphatase family protein [Gemmatimonadales bacterium]|nr:alkaline phosphatase family protein [Gemmatimonadales bacterium]
MRRVMVILIDGLRPDVAPTGMMPSLAALSRDYARATNARTVRPSATVAALASFATGVGPAAHGLVEPGLRFLRRLGRLTPLASALRARDIPTIAVANDLGRPTRPIAATLAAFAGVQRLVSGGFDAASVAASARSVWEEVEDGFVFVYFNACDRAGHRYGWMSRPYLDAAAQVDAALATLTGVARNGLLLVTADHGGGGVRRDDHDEPHPMNDWVPLTVAGPRVRRRAVLAAPISLLDLPPTILWYFGAPIPPSYEGRILREAFVPAAAPATAEP